MLRGVFLVGVLMMHGLLAGCSPGYVLQAAYEQGKILSARRSIDQVLQDPATSSEHRDKLSLVLGARSFAEKNGLTPGDSFTTYAEVSRDPLAWVVVAARRDSFSLHTWWFPIVGRVPYKGFFDKEDAQEELDSLVKQGYEGSMRGTEAFSTLGWFNDPVLSTTLKNKPVRIVNTVIHESVHSTVWIPGSVAFNESLANFVGSVGGISFFNERTKACVKESGVCAHEKAYLEDALRDEQVNYEVSRVVDRLYEALEKLYAEPTITSEEKLARRASVFAEAVRSFRGKYPNASILKAVNNADIIQLKLYMTKLPLFGRLYAKEEQSLPRFIEKIREVQRQVEEDSAKDPFVVLEDIVGEAP
jgi:predicted aminopeptidase